MKFRNDPDGTRLPIKIDTATNGEFSPLPLSQTERVINAEAMQLASDAAKRLGITRRSYLVSSCGAAAVLLSINDTLAAAGHSGGRYNLPPEALYETAAADTAVAGQEFIFDVQLHHVNPRGKWRETIPAWEQGLRSFQQAQACSEEDPLTCLDRDHLIQEVFLDSDTTAAVLSSVPSAPDNPLTTEEAAVTRAMVDAMDGSARLLIHGLCHPNFPGHVEGMDEIHAAFGVAGWKTYTQWGPDGIGFWLDDENTGLRMIEKSRDQGVTNICVHKGLPLGDLSREFSTCRDVGVVASMYPDMNFLIYHSGYERENNEGQYDPDNAVGVNSLIKALEDSEIPRGGNVYAELGSTWRYVMRDTEQAAHLLGKLLLHLGEDNVLWGTDSIWYGSPQDQIQALRAFEISEEFQEKFGYPALTPAIKAKIFGLSSAKLYGLDPVEVRKKASIDPIGRERTAYTSHRDPSFMTYGPKSRREFMSLLRANGGKPA